MINSTAREPLHSHRRFDDIPVVRRAGMGQPQDAKKTHTVRGKVEGVDATAKSLTVNHGKVEGWMDGMTMKYNRQRRRFQNVKAGDTIEATVYDGDYTL